MTAASRTPARSARPPARRDIQRRRRRPRRTGTQPPAWRGIARTGTASAFIVLLIVPLGLPAYAVLTEQRPPSAPASDLTTLEGEPQELSVDASAVGPSTVRDSYAVTRAVPAGTFAYAKTANTFTNDPTSAIQWPFTQGVPIGSGFGGRSAPCRGCSSFHEGLDLNPGIGTPIQAIADGVVSDVGKPSGAWGYYVVIDHLIDGRLVSSVYAHMLKNSVNLNVGDPVKVTDYVGLVGSSGASTGAHLHLGIFLDGKRATDPYQWLIAHVGR